MPIESDSPAARLGELLVKASKLGQRELDQALLAQQEIGDRLGRVLMRLGLVSELDVARALAAQLGVELVETAAFPARPLFVLGLEPHYLLAHAVLPLRIDGDELHVAMANPQDRMLAKAIELASGLRVRPCVGLESELQAALARLYASQLAAPDDEDEVALEGLEDTEAVGADSDFVEHLRDLASEAPIIGLVNQLIARVIDLRASDIHVEPFESGLSLRYRVDGVLRQEEVVPLGAAAAVTSRIKLLASLNIAERRLPQDGRIRTRVKGHELDLRVSTLPTVHGESVVMRVLDRASIRLALEDMGFAEDNLARFNELLRHPHGIVLVTGPTGSGKTTTLYAALAKIDAGALKILTVEDPVEYQLEGVNQVQVHSQIGLTFASALRSILRQDPDIIMIGEMRDTETAQIAVQSALTGHLVLSTLHTNTAAAAITRLDDMGVPRYLITSTVNGVLAQRLLRCLCSQCREPHALSEAELRQYGLAAFMPRGAREIYRARGCPACKQTGYLGRTSIHELFVLGEEARQAVLGGADAATLHAVARRAGMLTLYEDGLRKVAAGVTSIDEVLRVTQDQGDA